MLIHATTLQIRPLGDKFQLFGEVMAKDETGQFVMTRIRKRNKNLVVLEVEMQRLKDEAENYRLKLVSNIRAAKTRLTEAQLHDAECAVAKLPHGRTLLECVEHTIRTLGANKPYDCREALAAWKRSQEQRRRKAVTIHNSTGRVRRFLDATKFQYLTDIDPVKTRDWVYRTDSSPYNQCNDANNLMIWLNFCVAEKFIKEKPVEFDIGTMQREARPETEPEVLQTNECQRLLDASVSMYDGSLGAYVVLGLWCFIRPEEVKRLGPKNFVMHGNEMVVDHRGEKRGSTWRHTTVPANMVPIIRHAIEAGYIAPYKETKDGKGKTITEGGVYYGRTRWMRIREAAGLVKLEGGHARGTKPTIVEGSNEFCTDILRHTGMSYLFQRFRNEGKSVQDAIHEVVSQAGNSKRVAFLHYLRAVKADACEVFFKIKPRHELAVVAPVVSITDAEPETESVAGEIAVSS